MLSFFILSLPAMVPAFVILLPIQPITVLLMASAIISQGIALYYAYRPEANAWFEGEKIVPAQSPA